MKRTLEELISDVRSIRSAESPDDRELEVIENLNDTITAGVDDADDWETRYKDLRERYIKRFTEGVPKPDGTGVPDDQQGAGEPEPKTKYDDLFEISK